VPPSQRHGPTNSYFGFALNFCHWNLKDADERKMEKREQEIRIHIFSNLVF
jgi:hypothetical protein